MRVRRIRTRYASTKRKVIVLSVISILFITVAYAGFQEELHVYGNTSVGNPVFHFNYTGNVQTFVVSKTGNYQIELWGASGMSWEAEEGSSTPGKGGYTSGVIPLEVGETLYIYVGQQGNHYCHKIFNGGGWSLQDATYCLTISGGGATDVRLHNGEWDSFESLKSRIMVAGGGGSAEWLNSIGGSGGGLVGKTGTGTFNPFEENDGTLIAYGGTQTSGGTWSGLYNGVGGDNGSFGKAGFRNQSIDYGGSGGGGYYGGASRIVAQAGGGGSSFISGYEGCDAIDESSTEDNIIHTGSSIHYSGKVFTNAKMIDGDSSMPKPNGDGNVIGNTGDGHAKITYLTEG